MPGRSQPWVTVGSIIAGFVMIGCLCCGAAGYVGLMVMARVDQKKKLEQGANQGTRLNDLKLIGVSLQNHRDSAGRGPANLGELKPFLDDNGVAERIRKGEIVVVWNAGPPDRQDAGPADVVAAWEAQPTDDGKRLVVFLDGSAGAINESDFARTPKAKTKDQ
jgi:hypothetical protein